MDDASNPLIQNFAGFGYREAKVLTDQFGAGSIRKAIIQTQEGDALLETKGGMPRVTPLEPQSLATVCSGVVSPLSEHAGAREYWEPVGEGLDARVFSLDGLLSLPKRVVKTIKTIPASGHGVSFRLADGTQNAVTRVGDLVESTRTLVTKEIPTWFVRGLAFVSSSCVESIVFTNGRCPVTLRFNAQLQAPYGTQGAVYGDYSVMTTTPMAIGASTLEFISSGKRLTCAWEDGQAFLEPYSYKVLPSLRTGGTLLPTPTVSTVMPGAYFSLDKWGSPFKYFAHSTGLYLDEHRSVKITTPDPKTFPATASESTPARYFNFSALDDVQAVGTDCFIKHDIQFNGGVAYPGENPVTLGGSEHLYRDETGAVWRIQFSSVAVTDYTVLVTARLTGRVDTFLDDAGASVVARDLVTQVFPLMVPDAYSKPKGFGAMFVDSLPDGTQASIAINCPSVDVPPQVPESVIILKGSFSGIGGITGGGVAASFEQFPTVTTSRSTTDTPIVVPTLTGKWQVDVGNTPPAGGCACETNSSGSTTNPNWVASTWLFLYAYGQTASRAAMAFDVWTPRSSLTLAAYSTRTVGTLMANIQLVARADSTWDMLKVEYTRTYLNTAVVSYDSSYIRAYIYYCWVLPDSYADTYGERGNAAACRTERTLTSVYDSRIETSTVETITYSCGGNSITGFAKFTPSLVTVRDEAHGFGTYDPQVDTGFTYTTPETVTESTVGFMRTPFSDKTSSATRTSAFDNTSTSGATGAWGDWVTSGSFNIYDKITIDPTHAAGNVQQVTYIFDERCASPPVRTTVDELVHGISITKPISGVTACDDPRNSRVVLLADADAGLFF